MMHYIFYPYNCLLIQKQYNLDHGITPVTIQKSIRNILDSIYEADYVTVDVSNSSEGRVSAEAIPAKIVELRTQMKDLATKLEFEQAALVRDEIKDLEKRLLLEYGEAEAGVSTES